MITTEHITAEHIFSQLRVIPLSERTKFFNILAKHAFDYNDDCDDNLTHEELFGDLKDAKFTAKEAISFLEISPATFRRYIKDGKISAILEVGTSHFYGRDDLYRLKKAINLLKNK